MDEEVENTHQNRFWTARRDAVLMFTLPRVKQDRLECLLLPTWFEEGSPA